MQQYVLYQLIRWTRYQASFIKGLEGIFLKALSCAFSPLIVVLGIIGWYHPPLSGYQVQRICIFGCYHHCQDMYQMWGICEWYRPPLTLWNGIELKDTSKLSVLNFKMWHFYFAKMKKYLRAFIFPLHFALMMFAEGEATKYGCLWFECVTIFHYSSNQHQTSKKIEIPQSPKRKSKFV